MVLALTNVDTAVDVTLAGGIFSQAMDCGTGHDWIVVIANGGSTHSATCTVGAETLPKLGDWNNIAIYAKLTGTMPEGSQTVTWSQFYHGATGQCAVYTGTSYGEAEVEVLDGDSGAAESKAQTIDTGTQKALAMMGAQHNGALAAAVSGFTEDLRGATGYQAIGHEAAELAGSRLIGWGTTGLGSWGIVALKDGTVNLEPDKFGMTFSWRAGVAVALSGDIVLRPNRLRGLVFGMRQPRLGALAQRQVPLVGGIPDTSEMTEGGDEGDVLVQHAGRPATWEVFDLRSAARLIGMTGEILVQDGSAGPNGIVPSEYVEMTTARTTTSATLEDIIGATVDITVERTSHVVAWMNCHVSTNAVCDLNLAINFDGTDHDETVIHLNTNDEGNVAIIHRTATELPPGTYTVKGRFRRSGGGGTPEVDRVDLVVQSLGLSGPVMLTNEAEDDYAHADI